MLLFVLMLMLMLVLVLTLMLVFMFVFMFMLVFVVMLVLVFMFVLVLVLMLMLVFMVMFVFMFMLMLVLVLVLMLVAMVVVVPMTGVSQQSVGVGGSTVQHLIHRDVDHQPASSRNKHHERFLHKLFRDHSQGGLIHDENDEEPDDEDIGQGSKEFHAVVAEGHLGVGPFLGEVEEEDGEDEGDGVADQMDCIGDDGDGVGDDPCHYFPSDEDDGDDDDHDESNVVAAVVLLRRRTVQSFHIPPLLFLRLHTKTMFSIFIVMSLNIFTPFRYYMNFQPSLFCRSES
jgi:hypothetical protein